MFKSTDQSDKVNKGSHVCKGWSFDISLTWFERVSLGMNMCQVINALVTLDRNYSYPKLDFEGLFKSALFVGDVRGGHVNHW